MPATRRKQETIKQPVKDHVKTPQNQSTEKTADHKETANVESSNEAKTIDGSKQMPNEPGTPHENFENHVAKIRIDPTFDKTDSRPSGIILDRDVKANYSHIREKLLRATPSRHHCRLFCGGRKCKYCNPSGDQWNANQKVIRGIFSHWITKDILAIARPTTEGMEKHQVVEQFKNNGISSIVNLTRIGEHSACGPPLHSSGFSYNPEDFMKNDIFYYNFGWPDFGVAQIPTLLDMVKVLYFALSQGKVAIHCHAGLGRTGVLICCFLVWHQRLSAPEAVQLVRSKRTGSVQTSDQVDIIYQFAEYVKPLRMIFFPGISFDSYMQTQREVLHGYEARTLKNIPKILYVIAERLLELFGINQDGTILSKLSRLPTNEEGFYEKLQCKLREEIGYIRTLELPNLPPSSAARRSPISPANSSTNVSKTNLAKEALPSISVSQKVIASDNGLVKDEPTAVASADVFSQSSESETEDELAAGKYREKSAAKQPNVSKPVDEESMCRMLEKQLSDSMDVQRLFAMGLGSAPGSLTAATLRRKESRSSTEKSEEGNQNEDAENCLQSAQRLSVCIESLKNKTKYQDRLAGYKKRMNSNNDGWNALASESDSSLLFNLIECWFDCFTAPLISFTAKDGKRAEGELILKPWQKETLLYLCQLMLCLSGGNDKILLQSAEVIARWFTKRPYDRLANRFVMRCFTVLQKNCRRQRTWST